MPKTHPRNKYAFMKCTPHLQRKMCSLRLAENASGRIHTDSSMKKELSDSSKYRPSRSKINTLAAVYKLDWPCQVKSHIHSRPTGNGVAGEHNISCTKRLATSRVSSSSSPQLKSQQGFNRFAARPRERVYGDVIKFRETESLPQFSSFFGHAFGGSRKKGCSAGVLARSPIMLIKKACRARTAHDTALARTFFCPRTRKI